MAASSDLWPVVITGLLSAGGATFLGAMVRGYGTLRAGARARERETVMDLSDARDRAEGREQAAAADRDFWRAVAGKYGYQLRHNGINPDPADPVQPSDRPPERPSAPPSSRRR